MKAAPFEYSRAADIDEACAMLAADDSARVIAGGQTLVPMMVMRLARPTRLIDINRIAALSYIRNDGDGVAIGATTRQCVVERDALVAARVPLLARAIPNIGQVAALSYIRNDGDGVAIGATTRQCVVERDALVAARVPLLARAIPNIGHAATRARGTIGGSLANADPAAELPLIAITLDAVLSYRASGETAEIPAREFFIGPMITTLPAGGCLTGARFPVWQGEKIGVGFHEAKSLRSDFAFVSAAAQVELGADGKCKRIVIGVGAVTDFPMRLDSAEQQLMGTTLDAKAVDAAVRVALADIDALADLQ